MSGPKEVRIYLQSYGLTGLMSEEIVEGISCHGLIHSEYLGELYSGSDNGNEEAEA